MKRYTVVLTQTAEKEIRRLPSKVIEKIIAVLKSLEENPRPAGCKKLKGYKDLWRIRVGDYRQSERHNGDILIKDYYLTERKPGFTLEYKFVTIWPE
jgi:mRNA interferase RelE/StbE